MTLKHITRAAVLALSLGASGAMAAGEGEITDFAFSFEGPFGSFDRNQVQRGLQIYTSVCKNCHGLELVALRNLADEGGPELPEDQMRAYAQAIEVPDGSGGFRPATPADYFPKSELAEAPDLSLMAKARAGFHGPYGLGINQFFKGMGGPEYIASLLSGYHEAPACAPTGFPGHYNVAFANGGFPEECIDEHGHHTVPGSWIAMEHPLIGDDVVYADGTPATVQQEAQDVAAFLMWAAEPKLNARKEAGLTGVIFLIVLSVLLYLTNKRLWAPHKPKKS